MFVFVQDVLSELARERLASPEQSKENEETATFELLKLTDGQVQPSSDKPAETLSPLKLVSLSKIKSYPLEERPVSSSWTILGSAQWKMSVWQSPL